MLQGVARRVGRLLLTEQAVACPVVAGFYEPRSCSIQYVVSDPATKACAIIDPVLDFDEKSGCGRDAQRRCDPRSRRRAAA